MTLPKHDPEKLDVTGPDRQTPKQTFGEPVHATPRPPVLTPGPDLPAPVASRRRWRSGWRLWRRGGRGWRGRRGGRGGVECFSRDEAGPTPGESHLHDQLSSGRAASPGWLTLQPGKRPDSHRMVACHGREAASRVSGEGRIS